MNKTKIVFGIGIVLTVLAVLTAPAAADYDVFHLVPEDSSCDGVGCTTTVWVMMNVSQDNVNAAQASIIFDPSVVNVTLVEEGTDPDWLLWDWHIFTYGGYTYVKISPTDFTKTFGPEELEIGKMTLQCEAPGVSALHFGNELELGGDRCEVSGTTGMICGPTGSECTMIDGTFTCTGPPPPPEATVYFVPEDIVVEEGYCNSATVEVWVDTNFVTRGGEFEFNYTFCCANITDFEGNPDWDDTNWFNVPEEGLAGVDFEVEEGAGPGQLYVGTLTIHCCDESSDCVTDLTWWPEQCILMDLEGNDIWVENFVDGTFTCLKPAAPDLIVTDINAYHNNTGCPAWFNLSNEIDVTVKNIGTANATETFNVCVSIDGVPFDGKLSVSGLNINEEKTVTFEDWMPIGEDCLQPPCDFELLAKYYNFTAVADCDGVVSESNETNNETTVVDKACYNGYMADEPLENVAHGKLHGHMIYTTGDGAYTGLYSVGDTQVTNYDITIPAGATVEVANLNVYYTWTKPQGTCPEMEVSIKKNGGTPQVLTLEKAYNDVKCTCPGASWILTWGNYVYDLTDYIDGSGTYTVTVKNVCTACYYFCPAAPGIVLVYEDTNAPMMEYWINKGADVLMGGRRYPTSSNLAWWENINNATFQASTQTCEVESATLGVVAPWGDSVPNDILFFNDVELGRGVYHGYSSLYNETIDSLSMYVGASGNAQVGANVTDVTARYLQGSDNVVGQADDGDNIMACNAFLVVQYKMPDLNVTEIKPNCGYLFGNESNEICAKIENIGGDDAGAFNVSFVADGFSEEVRISGLAAGANTTVCVTDPTLRNAGDAVSITVTADCNAEVVESDETNNASTLPTTVVNNGYKGKRYTGGEDITIWKTFELNGNLIYSLGDSYYASGYAGWTKYNASWTASELPVPVGATIEEARLYAIYTWDRNEGMPDIVSMTFNGETQILNAHYSDRKSYGGWDYPYGMLAYDVTGNFSTSGNIANLTNSETGKTVSMRGMLLVVIYADDSEPLRKIIMNEEFDLLYGGSGKCTTPEEATAYAPFGPIDLTGVKNATLITVAPGAGPDEGELLFNGQTWTNVWNFAGNSQIGINETNVTDYLQSTDNEAGFQSSGDYMETSNAFLVVEYKVEPISSCGDSILFKRNVRRAWRALGEPDNRGALMFRNAKIAIELEETIPECQKVSIWVRRVAARPPRFDIGVSSDGKNWTPIGSATCYSFGWTRYDFTGDWDDVKYIGIRKPGGRWRPKLMGLDAVCAEGSS